MRKLAGGVEIAYAGDEYAKRHEQERGPESEIARAVVPGEAGVGDPAGPFGSMGHAVDRVMLEV